MALTEDEEARAIEEAEAVTDDESGQHAAVAELERLSEGEPGTADRIAFEQWQSGAVTLSAPLHPGSAAVLDAATPYQGIAARNGVS